MKKYTPRLNPTRKNLDANIVGSYSIPPTRLYSKATREAVLCGLPPKWLYLHARRRYVEQKILATPPWVSHRDFLDLQIAKMERTLETGVQHTLDHIIPLNHPMVCGLNVPWNIQVIPAGANAAKSNNWNPDQQELFN